MSDDPIDTGEHEPLTLDNTSRLLVVTLQLLIDDYGLAGVRHTLDLMEDEMVDTRKLRFAVQDRIWQHFDVNDSENVDWFIENIEEPLLALICQYEGHEVIDDMCHRPDHRYCVKCNKAMPNQPVTA